MASLVQLKGDTLARFEKINPVLRIKEPALIALDPANPTKYTHMVIGDGKSKFKDLPMLNMGVSQDYEKMENLPSIENVELIGNVTLEQLGAVYQEDFDKRLPLVIDLLASNYREKVLAALDSINKGAPVPVFLKVTGVTLYVCGWRMMDDGTMLWITAPLAVTENAFVELGITAYSVNTTDGSIVALNQTLTKVLGESALVQEVGMDPNKVISQKTITELFGLVNEAVDDRIEKLPIELTIEGEDYVVTTPLETLSKYAAKFYADPSAYAWQITFVVGSDKLGVIPIFLISYGGIHIGFYNPDMSGTMKLIQIMLDGTTVTSATVGDWTRTLVEVVQTTGSDTQQVMSQDAVTKALKTQVDAALAAAKKYTDDGVSSHNTSETAHADIRELLNTCVGLPAYDSSSYKITFTTLAGATVEIDLPIEQLALRYNAETDSIEFDNADGTTTSIPVSAFVKEYVGSIGDRIQVSIDENNVIHATILKNSIDWDCLSFELQERINDHVTSADFAAKAVRTDITQTLSIEAQNQALKNIGADLMIIDIVKGQAVLTEEQEARLLSSKGVILRGTTASPEVLSHIFHSDIQTGDVVGFYSFRKNDYCLTCQYTKSTKTFKVIGNTALRDNSAVVFNREQSLTASQQEQALANLGMKVYVTDSTFLGYTLSAEEIEEVFVSKAILFTDTGDLFSFGAANSSQIYFYKFINRSSIGYITLNKPSGLVSNGSFGYQDVNAVHFTAQNPALTSAQQEQAWSNLGFDLVVLKFPEGATSVTLTDEEDAKLAAGAAVLVTVDGTNTGTGVHNADNHIFVSYNFTMVLEPRYYSLWSHTSILYCSYKKASKTFVYKGSLQLNDTGALRTDRLTSLTGAQQSQAFKNLGWKVHVISESAIGSSDAVSDDEKAARLSATTLLVQETGLLYNFSISSGGSRCFYGQFSNSFCTALNVNEATGVITSSFAYLYDPSAVSFDRDQSSVSDDNKNKALGNIGIDLVRIPHSLLGTTLSDEMFAVLDNARGIILVDTPSDYRNPTVFVKGNNTSGSCIFVAFVTGNTYCIFTLNKSTKLLSGISSGLTYGGSVRYAEVQNLTTSQQDTALSNIGLDFVHVDYALLNTTLDDSTAALVENANGLILFNVPNNERPVILPRCSFTNNVVYFNSWRGVYLVDQITYNVGTKALSAIWSTEVPINSVKYNAVQNLTDTQKQQARTNIGVQSADELLEDADFIASLKVKLGIE